MSRLNVCTSITHLSHPKAESRRILKWTGVCLILFLSANVQADPWPGEPWAESLNLTALDTEFEEDLSGAFWNPQTRVLWVCQNGAAKIWALIEDGLGGFAVREDGEGNRYEWDLGSQDLEDLTQVSLAQDLIYLIDEGTGTILCVDLSNPTAHPLIRSWNVSSGLPSYAGGLGPEGISFVEDEWLVCRQFKDRNGSRYHSQKGMNGLMFIAHQQQGQVYVFDLNPDITNDYLFVGQYDTSRDESCAVGFDRNLGLMYIWHNTGANYLEITDLDTSALTGQIRQFRTVTEYVAPRSGNLEGFSAAPQAGINAESWCFITQDDGGTDSLRWFDSFQIPDVTPPDYSSGLMPRVVSTGSVDVTLGVAMNEIGSVYYIIVPDGVVSPDYKQVRGGVDAEGLMPLFSGKISIEQTGVEYTQTVSGLIPDTSYDAYCVGEDESAILQTSAYLLEFVTLSAIPTSTPEPTETPIEPTPTPQPVPVEGRTGLGLIVAAVSIILLISTKHLM